MQRPSPLWARPTMETTLPLVLCRDSRGESERMSWCWIVCSWLPARLDALAQVRLLSLARAFTNYMYLIQPKAYSTTRSSSFPPFSHILSSSPSPGSFRLATTDDRGFIPSSRLPAAHMSVYLVVPQISQREPFWRFDQRGATPTFGKHAWLHPQFYRL